MPPDCHGPPSSRLAMTLAVNFGELGTRRRGMKSFALTLDLKDDPELIAQYKARHRAVWPEVTAGLRGIGIKRMKIFLLGRRMFMYIEAPDDFDPARDFAGYMDNPRAKEWDDMMREFQERVPEAAGDEWWASMEEVFDIDWFPA